jgi:hypothetical protein
VVTHRSRSQRLRCSARILKLETRAGEPSVVMIPELNNDWVVDRRRLFGAARPSALRRVQC